MTVEKGSRPVMVYRAHTPHIDTRNLVDTLSHLATIPTDVPLGFNTLMEPDDPKLVYYVQEVIRR